MNAAKTRPKSAKRMLGSGMKPKAILNFPKMPSVLPRLVCCCYGGTATVRSDRSLMDLRLQTVTDTDSLRIQMGLRILKGMSSNAEMLRHKPHSSALYLATNPENADEPNRDHNGENERRDEPNGQPPKFGHGMLKYFGFAKDYVNLNSGESEWIRYDKSEIL